MTRDFILTAARYLNKSDWKMALKTLFEIPALKKLPEYFDGSLQKNLSAEFQKSALSAFLDRTAKQYKSFSLSTLSEMFESDKKDIVRFLSKKILNN